MSAPKRFYKSVDTAPADDGYHITLDGRVLKTPGKHPLIAPGLGVARLIAAEWDAQDKEIRPETMPVTRLMNVAIEITPRGRDALLDEAVKYAGTDLLCYRATKPQSLRDAQAEAFDEILDWLSKEHAILLTVTDTVLVDQDSEETEKFRTRFCEYDDLRLTLALHFTAVFSSVGLALAVMENRLSATDALQRSCVDELYQIERWGEDEEAAERAESIRKETLGLAKVLEVM